MRSNHTQAEDGSTLLLSLLVAVLLAGMTAATAAYVVNTLPQTRQHEDWNLALAAAEAGVEDVLVRLNQDPTFWTEEDADNLARDGWRTIPGFDDGAEYHYFIDSSQVGSTGAIDVISTGRSGDSTRTIEARLRRDGFLENIYFTDFEVSDPYAMVANSAQRNYLDDYCAEYYPNRDESAVSATAGEGGCSSIRFPETDTLVGPTRSNDAILMQPGPSGPNFLGPVRTGWTGDASGQLWREDDGSVGQPNLAEGITSVSRLPLPDAASSLDEAAAEDGCVYEGPTYIRFSGSNMTVVSPLTDPTAVNSGCGTGTTADGISSTVPIPDGEAIYVENSAAAPSGHPLGMPHPDDDVSTFSSTAGDAFVWGEVDAQVTVGVENDLYIVWHLTQNDTSSDSPNLVGLVANNNVWVYHPVRSPATAWGWNTRHSTVLPAAGPSLPPFASDPTNPFGSNQQFTDPRIDAAILALNRSFSVHNSGYGEGNSMGVLNIYGAIAQRWRGPVARGSAALGTVSGYDKNYVHDSRLEFLSPPHFIQPEQSPWRQRTFAELDAPEPCASGDDPRVDGCLPS